MSRQRKGADQNGRKPNQLTERFPVMMTMRQRENLNRKAAERGVNPSELIRQWIDSDANQTEITL